MTSNEPTYTLTEADLLDLMRRTKRDFLFVTEETHHEALDAWLESHAITPTAEPTVAVESAAEDDESYIVLPSVLRAMLKTAYRRGNAEEADCQGTWQLVEDGAQTVALELVRLLAAAEPRCAGRKDLR